MDGDEDDGEFFLVEAGSNDVGFDDVIYPVDYRTAGHIIDDEMHDIMFVPFHSSSSANG